MILTLDLGNTALKCALFDGKKAVASFALSSVRRTADEWALSLSEHLKSRDLPRAAVDGAILGSVVPYLTDPLSDAVASLFGKAPLTVGPGIKTGLDIRTERQSELGADIVANAVGARVRFKTPFVVVDFGTATTVSAVDGAGVFRGVAILPGVGSAAAALARTCANLPEITPGEPASLLGKNTRDSLNGGLTWGFAVMADALVDRVVRETGISDPALIATGGAAGRILPLCEKKFNHRPALTSEGLLELYEINRPSRKA